MAKSSTTFEAGQDKPGRGKSFKNKLLEVIKEESLIEATPQMSEKAVEKLYIKHLAKRAFDITDQASATLSKELLSKSYPTLKSTMPIVEFDFPKDSKPHVQASYVLSAVANGLLPSDIGNIFVQSIKAMIDIEEYTDLKDRIEAIEKKLGVANG